MKLALHVCVASVLVWVFASIAASFRSNDFYTHQNFHHFNSEITDLNAAKIPKPNDPRNPCPWPEYPHVAGRYCERRCGGYLRDRAFISGWCELAETQAEIQGDDYKCICPRRLARHTNGSCVPLTHCPAEFVPSCSENETLTACPSNYNFCAFARPYLRHDIERLGYCDHYGSAPICACRQDFFRNPEANHSCVRYEDCPLATDDPIELALIKALAAHRKCPGDYEIPRCGNECEDLHCANLTDILDDVERINRSNCAQACENGGSYRCVCMRGLVRHAGRCTLPENCPRSTFPECPENEQLNFFNGTDFESCPERNCSDAATQTQTHQELNGALPPWDPSAVYNSCGMGFWQRTLVRTQRPRCWCPRATHFRNSTGACVSAMECQSDPVYIQRKAKPSQHHRQREEEV